MLGSRHALLLSSALVALALTACKTSTDQTTPRRKVSLTVAGVGNFDPNKDVSLDAYWGAARPDDYAVQVAFEQAFGDMDTCILSHKKQNNIPNERTLRGEMEFQVRLNPEQGPALGVNAKLPGKYDKSETLKNCLSEVVAKAPFPKYDGPPIVAEFRTELGPGTYFDEDE